MSNNKFYSLRVVAPADIQQRLGAGQPGNGNTIENAVGLGDPVLSGISFRRLEDAEELRTIMQARVNEVGMGLVIEIIRHNGE